MQNRGFTLMELLVVVLIIGILAAAALPQYETAVEKSRAAEAVSVLKSLHQAQKVYFMQNGTHTSDLNNLDLTLPNTQDKNMGQGITGKRTKFFVYYTNYDANGVSGLYARRLNSSGDTLYALGIGHLKDDSWTCCYMQEKFKRVCRSLGMAKQWNGLLFSGSLECFRQE